MTASLSLPVLPSPQPPRGLRRRTSDLLYTRRGVLLLALLANAFFGLDDFTGLVVREFTLKNFIALAQPANVDAALRTIVMAVAVTAACALLAFPLAYYMARHARGASKAALYIAVMLPLWSS